MEHFVTLFDSNYLVQGLSLHKSMRRHLSDFTLWIICVDEDAFRILNQLELPYVRLLILSELESKELLNIKSDRTTGEYCWTLTPFSPRFVFDADKSVERVTYIDADMWFRANPIEIFNEFTESGKSVMITYHSYSPEYDQSATSGKFCVQFMIFKRDGSELVRSWWEARCLEWCYARFEDGKFGDQKYLDYFPQLFNDRVHILRNFELIQAPWNATRFPYGSSVVWHFHGLRIFNSLLGTRTVIGEYYIPSTTFRNIYLPYFDDLKSSLALLSSNNYNLKSQIKNPFRHTMKLFLKLIYHSILKISYKFNIIIWHLIHKN